MYKRKTIDIWELHVNYGQGYEHELTEFTRAEIKQRAKEYWANCPQYATKVIKKREKVHLAENQPNTLYYGREKNVVTLECGHAYNDDCQCKFD